MSFEYDTPRAFAGLSSDEQTRNIFKISKFLKKNNPRFEEWTLDDIGSEIVHIAHQYKNLIRDKSETFVSASGVVFTYYHNSIGNVDVKLSIDTCVLP